MEFVKTKTATLGPAEVSFEPLPAGLTKETAFAALIEPAGQPPGAPPGTKAALPGNSAFVSEGIDPRGTPYVAWGLRASDSNTAPVVVTGALFKTV